MKLKVEIISTNPTMCREWVEKPQNSAEYYSALSFDQEIEADKKISEYHQRLASLPTYLLISDGQYRVGDVVEARWHWQYNKGGWIDCSEKDYNEMPVPLRRIVAIPVKTDNIVGTFKFDHEKMEETYTENPNFGKPIPVQPEPGGGSFITDQKHADEVFEKLKRTLEPEAEAMCGKVMMNDQPFPLIEVLRILTSASKYLLDSKDYDGPDWEEIGHCIKSSEKIQKIIADESTPCICEQYREALEKLQEKLTIGIYDQVEVAELKLIIDEALKQQQ